MPIKMMDDPLMGLRRLPAAPAVGQLSIAYGFDLAKPIYRSDGEALRGGDLNVGHAVIAVYDGTRWCVVTWSPFRSD